MRERENPATFAEDDVEGHLSGTNVNETVVEDEQDDDVEGHLAGTNVNETVVEDDDAPPRG